VFNLSINLAEYADWKKEQEEEERRKEEGKDLASGLANAMAYILSPLGGRDYEDDD